jgi:hypothetical protein
MNPLTVELLFPLQPIVPALSSRVERTKWKYATIFCLSVNRHIDASRIRQPLLNTSTASWIG